MTPAGPGRRSSRLSDLALVVGTILVCTILTEGVVRFLDGRPLLAFPLAEPVGPATVSDRLLDKVARAAGVERDWFFSDPPPLPNRRPVPDEWMRLFRHLEQHPSGHNEFRPVDMFKAWNAVAAGDPCRHRFLRFAPGHLLVHDPSDGEPTPPYRFPPDATLPTGLVTNQLGWRGRPLEVPRRPRTVRIVFVGSSTVIDFHHVPFSYPEFVGHWLNRWAAARHPDVRFEVLNSARESNVSADLMAIVRKEIVPLRPDLVVYSEGGNQFELKWLVDKMPDAKAAPPQAARGEAAPSWLRGAARYSALAARLLAATGYLGAELDGKEWPKPDYRLVWPSGLDEQDPDLAYPALPVNLNEIQRHLDRIRADLATVGGELALSSFIWMAKDGLVLDPLRHRYILESLNVGNHPFRYRDIERLAAFQNRVFAKYARTHGLPFVDVAGTLPLDPDLFADAVHSNYAGIRLKAWATLQQLIPAIEKRLADKTWPRAQPAPELPLPTYTPRRITFACR